jgi:hypothetical protein
MAQAQKQRLTSPGGAMDNDACARISRFPRICVDCAAFRFPLSLMGFSVVQSAGCHLASKGCHDVSRSDGRMQGSGCVNSFVNAVVEVARHDHAHRTSSRCIEQSTMLQQNSSLNKNRAVAGKREQANAMLYQSCHDSADAHVVEWCLKAPERPKATCSVFLR